MAITTRTITTCRLLHILRRRPSVVSMRVFQTGGVIRLLRVGLFGVVFWFRAGFWCGVPGSGGVPGIDRFCGRVPRPICRVSVLGRRGFTAPLMSVPTTGRPDVFLAMMGARSLPTVTPIPCRRRILRGGVCRILPTSRSSLIAVSRARAPLLWVVAGSWFLEQRVGA